MGDRYIDGQVSDLFLNAVRRGEAFRAGALFKGIATTDGTEKILVLKNTKDDRVLLISKPTIRASGQVFASKRRNVSIDTTGASVTVTNKRSDTNGVGGIEATTAGDNETGLISGGSAYPQINVGSGSNASNAVAGDSGETGISDFVYPNDTFAVIASNQSGSAIDVSIAADIIGVPVDRI